MEYVIDIDCSATGTPNLDFPSAIVAFVYSKTFFFSFYVTGKPCIKQNSVGVPCNIQILLMLVRRIHGKSRLFLDGENLSRKSRWKISLQCGLLHFDEDAYVESIGWNEKWAQNIYHIFFLKKTWVNTTCGAILASYADAFRSCKPAGWARVCTNYDPCYLSMAGVPHSIFRIT